MPNPSETKQQPPPKEIKAPFDRAKCVRTSLAELIVDSPTFYSVSSNKDSQGKKLEERVLGDDFKIKELSPEFKAQIAQMSDEKLSEKSQEMHDKQTAALSRLASLAAYSKDATPSVFYQEANSSKYDNLAQSGGISIYFDEENGKWMLKQALLGFPQAKTIITVELDTIIEKKPDEVRALLTEYHTMGQAAYVLAKVRQRLHYHELKPEEVLPACMIPFLGMEAEQLPQAASELENVLVFFKATDRKELSCKEGYDYVIGQMFTVGDAHMQLDMTDYQKHLQDCNQGAGYSEAYAQIANALVRAQDNQNSLEQSREKFGSQKVGEDVWQFPSYYSPAILRAKRQWHEKEQKKLKGKDAKKLQSDIDKFAALEEENRFHQMLEQAELSMTDEQYGSLMQIAQNLNGGKAIIDAYEVGGYDHFGARKLDCVICFWFLLKKDLLSPNNIGAEKIMADLLGLEGLSLASIAQV